MFIPRRQKQDIPTKCYINVCCNESRLKAEQDIPKIYCAKCKYKGKSKACTSQKINMLCMYVCMYVCTCVCVPQVVE